MIVCLPACLPAFARTASHPTHHGIRYLLLDNPGQVERDLRLLLTVHVPLALPLGPGCLLFLYLACPAWSRSSARRLNSLSSVSSPLASPILMGAPTTWNLGSRSRMRRQPRANAATPAASCRHGANHEKIVPTTHAVSSSRRVGVVKVRTE